MSAPIEVLLSSDQSGQLWNTCVWDINTGTSITAYKGDTSSHRGLCILGNQYLLGASCVKPLIHVWALQRRDQQQQKIICPGRVTALVASPDGALCIAAVAEKIHIWQVCTGNLLAVVSRHYQKVNVLRLTDNGSHLVSGGEDNLVIVWSIADILSCLHNPSKRPDPYRLWSSHSLPVTDLHVGHGGSRARVVSSSLDHTCKIWDIVSGSLLQTVVFPTSILSVVMDTAEYRLFAGGSSGDVYCVNMYGQPITTERHIESHDQQGVTCFKGHSKQVTSVAVTMDGSKITTGSHDCTVRIWDVQSGQCVRTLHHKGSVTNVMIVPTPPAINNPQLKPTLPLLPFKRHLYTGIMGDNSEEQSNPTVRICPSRKYVWVKQLSGVPKGVMWPAKVISQSASADFVDIYIKSDNAEMEKYLHRSREVDDVEQSLLGELTTTEKYLMKSQELMWIRGKRGKRVPVLIPNDTSKALTYITDKEVRKIGGVKSTNQYMFATKGDGIIRASECIKQLGNENANELIHPDRLTSTGYRAYMATIAQCLGLKDHQIQWLCTHLGHTIDVHQSHYRFALDGIERIQLGKLLLLQDKNLLSKFKDTDLKDIEFEDIISCSENTVAGSCYEEADPSEVQAAPSQEQQLDVFEIDDIVDAEKHITEQKKKSAGVRVRWKEKETNELLKYAANFLNKKKTPSRKMEDEVDVQTSELSGMDKKLTSERELLKIKEEVQRVKSINLDLYQFTVNQILHDKSP